ncbi:DUF58 domain-containing protein [Fimbriiglobus ruber]|uniref:DUF58 domain-containing protein n=1 Tax=Fimbriiglobus ruber TaxID=1908690 RepID=A0A225EBB0_9BACT|nr:DUF58 domain-containing protein [Fimbriiglobus ruber]OWK46659.1 hypothetical protein FRUB_00358 [Fimbriiglobus ruber]
MTVPAGPIDAPLLSTEFLRRLEALELVSKKMLAGRMKGDRLSRRKGRGSEFADFRPYTVGDDLRFLDWSLYGRLEKLFLRLFLEEEDLTVYLLVDNSKSMDYGTPTKLRYARQVAAALGFVGLANMDRVVVASVGSAAPVFSPIFRGRPSMWRMVKFLENIPAGEVGDFGRSLRTVSRRATGQGVAVVLSDFMDKGGYEDGLRYLSARNLDVYAIHVLAQEEIDPPYTGDLKLTDVEDGDEAEVTISAPLLERYRNTLAAFRASVNGFCTRRGMAYLFTSNQVPFEKLVLGYLRSRGLLR